MDMSKLRVSIFHIFHVTLANAHMLKWARYSSVVIPPFPTSSMSGSDTKMDNVKPTFLIQRVTKKENKNYL